MPPPSQDNIGLCPLSIVPSCVVFVHLAANVAKRIRLAPSVAFSNTDATEKTTQKILGSACSLLTRGDDNTMPVTGMEVTWTDRM